MDNETSESFLIALPYDGIPGAAIFDCDGTLADTMPLHYQAWRECLDPLGCPFPEDLFYAWGGVTAREIIVRLNERHGMSMDPDATSHYKEELYSRLIPQVGEVALIVAEARRLHGNCPLAVASGGMQAVVRETLEALGIESLFETVVAAEDVTHCKPHPEPFLRAAERLGVAPGLCVVYEDSPAGLEAAKRAGMRAVDVRPYIAREPNGD